MTFSMEFRLFTNSSTLVAQRKTSLAALKGNKPMVSNLMEEVVDRKTNLWTFYDFINSDGFVKSLFGRLPGESRGPERLEITGFRLSPE